MILPSPWNLWIPLSVLTLYLTLLGLGVAFIRLNYFQTALCRGNPNTRTIALTFDDGPDPETTGIVLDILASHTIRATFFCVGERVERYPEMAQRIVQEGHVIGNHTMHHRWSTNFLFGKKLEWELRSAQQIIEHTTGMIPRYFRPPMGLTNPHYRSVLGKLALRMTGWDIRSLDVISRDPESILRRIATRVRAGSIILMHDTGQPGETLSTVLGGLIAHANENNLKFVTLDELQE